MSASYRLLVLLLVHFCGALRHGIAKSTAVALDPTVLYSFSPSCTATDRVSVLYSAIQRAAWDGGGEGRGGEGRGGGGGEGRGGGGEGRGGGGEGRGGGGEGRGGGGERRRQGLESGALEVHSISDSAIAVTTHLGFFSSPSASPPSPLSRRLLDSTALAAADKRRADDGMRRGDTKGKDAGEGFISRSLVGERFSPSFSPDNVSDEDLFAGMWFPDFGSSTASRSLGAPDCQVLDVWLKQVNVGFLSLLCAARFNATRILELLTNGTETTMARSNKCFWVSEMDKEMSFAVPHDRPIWDRPAEEEEEKEKKEEGITAVAAAASPSTSPVRALPLFPSSESSSVGSSALSVESRRASDAKEVEEATVEGAEGLSQSAETGETWKRFARTKHYRTSAAPNDPSFPSQWALKDSEEFSVKAQAAWARSATVRAQLSEDEHMLNATVGVVDGSFLQTHPDLEKQWHLNTGEVCANGIDDDGNGLIDDCRGWNFKDGSPDLLLSYPVESIASRHGTLVSGSIAAATNNTYGVASVCPQCRILPVAVSMKVSQILTATNYLISRGVRIINYSFVGPESSALRRAIESSPSVLFVTAAGNSACNVDLAVSMNANGERSADGTAAPLPENGSARQPPPPRDPPPPSADVRPPHLKKVRPLTPPPGRHEVLHSPSSSSSSSSWALPGSDGEEEEEEEEERKQQQQGAEDSMKAGGVARQTKHVAWRSSVCRSRVYPGALSLSLNNVVNVGALNAAGKPSAFSNYGRRAVQLFAPGENLSMTSNRQSTPTIDTASGSSFAAPIVSGIASLVLQKLPHLTACRLRKILQSSCVFNHRLKGISLCEGHISAAAALSRAAEEVIRSKTTYHNCDAINEISSTGRSTTSSTARPTHLSATTISGITSTTFDVSTAHGSTATHVGFPGMSASANSTQPVADQTALLLTAFVNKLFRLLRVVTFRPFTATASIS